MKETHDRTRVRPRYKYHEGGSDPNIGEWLSEVSNPSWREEIEVIFKTPTKINKGKCSDFVTNTGPPKSFEWPVPNLCLSPQSG